MLDLDFMLICRFVLSLFDFPHGNEWMNERMKGWKDERMKGWKDERMNEWMNEWRYNWMKK